MSLIMRYTEQVWSLLQTLGWWILLGLVLGCVIQCLPDGKRKKKGKNSGILLMVLGGALLPMCNFAAVPLAVALLARGAGAGAVLAFLGGATLLNPAGILSAWAYMGPELTVAYGACAIAAALLAGMAGSRISEERKPEIKRSALGYFGLAADVAFWVMIGILAEAALLTVVPASVWQTVMLDPQSVSVPQMAMAAIFRHVCIPDDVSLAASLVATGLRPGCAVVFLLLGVSTNLPELFVLYGMAGKKTAAVYALVTTAVSVVAAVLTELAIGVNFVPQFNLADAGIYTQAANLLSIRTWMSAKVPCAVLLVALALWGCRNRRK